MELIIANIIKFVFWDFGDTLVGLKSGVLHQIKQMIFQNCGRKVLITDLKKAMRDEWSLRDLPTERKKIKKVTTPDMEHQYYADFFGGTLRRLGFEDYILPELTTGLATLKTSPSSYYAFPDSLRIVNKLSKLGIKQAIISNGFHAAPQILAQLELRDKFEFEIWSYQNETIKPEQAIYNLALDRAGCRSEEALFIDDRKRFVEAAQKLGMFAIQIDRSQPKNIEPGNKNSFPIINNLSAIEKYLQSEKPVGKSKNGKRIALKENNSKFAV
jgi:FMN phosphatase YigB (HAD superfamily)